MGPVQAPKFCVKLLCRCRVCRSSGLDLREVSEGSLLTINCDLRGPLRGRLAPPDSLDSRLAVGARALVETVLRRTARSEVDAPTIETVRRFVIDLQTIGQPLQPSD